VGYRSSKRRSIDIEVEQLPPASAWSCRTLPKILRSMRDLPAFALPGLSFRRQLASMGLCNM
jgi:hypothetical protein